MHRSPLAATAALAAALLLAACGGAVSSEGTTDEPATVESSAPAEESAASDAGGEATTTAEDSTREESSAAEEPAADPFPVTPPPEGFEVADACTGEGAHRVALEEGAEPALPDRAGGSLDVQLTGIDGEGRAELTATVGDEAPRPIEPAAVGDTVEIELWTISVTSICEDDVEFDLVN